MDKPAQDITFLVTYFAQPELLKICLDSIRKFYPNDKIIVSQQKRDDPVDVGSARLIEHDMADVVWAGVAKQLIEKCDTEIGIFIEHDAFLLRNIDEEINLIKNGSFDLIGPEEVNHIRHSPGFISQNFFMLNVSKMKEIGTEKVYVRDIPKLKELQAEGKLQNIESGYGITQSFDNKMLLPVTPSGYAFGTYYGNMAHHLWYGSYRKRDTWIDNVSPQWMDHEANRLIEDYWNGKIKTN